MSRRAIAAAAMASALLPVLAAGRQVVDMDTYPVAAHVDGQTNAFLPDEIRVGEHVVSGDVNADGHDDIITAQGDQGVIVVFFGGPALAPHRDLSTAPADVTIQSVPRVDPNPACLGSRRFGGDELFPDPIAVGDVTGDGIDDLVIGATCWPAVSRQRGAVVILPGRASWPAVVDVDIRTWEPAILGEDVPGMLGMSLAIGDVDGDGVGDLVATAWDAPGADDLEYAGRAYVFRGPLPLAGRRDAGDAHRILLGGLPGGQLGRALHLGDLDGDGSAEMLFGIPSYDRVLVVREADLEPVSDLRDGRHVAAELGGDPWSRGMSVAVADLDCTGTSDVMVGVPGLRRPDGFHGGAVDVIAGAATIEELAEMGPGPRIFGQWTHQPWDSARAGCRVVAWDANADGFPDIVIGVRLADDDFARDQTRGLVYVVLNRPDLPPVLDLETAGDDVVAIRGPDAGSAFGWDLATGDVTGDGIPDLLVGQTFPSMAGGRVFWPNGSVDVLAAPLVGSPVTADAGADQVVMATDPDCTGTAVLDASGSAHAGGLPLRHRWFEGTSLLAEGERPAVRLGLGRHCLRLLAEADDGWHQDRVTVVVVDALAPRIHLTATPASLWPPNHRLVDVRVTATVEDACAPPEDLLVALVSVRSNEPGDGRRGDGRHQPDVQGFDVGRADFTGRLRAERSGRGGGRSYELTYRVSDPAGNSATASVTVEVAHDRGR